MADIKLQDGTVKALSAGRLQDGGTLRTMASAYRQNGSTLEKVWPPVVYVPMSGSVTGPSGSYTASSGSHAIGTSYLTVSDGDPPYTKSWRTSGAGFSASGSGTSVSVYCSKNSPGTYYGTVYCDVTDDTGHTVTFSRSISATVNVAYVSMSGSISPSSLSGSTTQSSGTYYTLGTASISVSDGDTPYSYAWSVSGSGLSITGGTTGSSATVRVSRSSTGTFTGTLQCVVTDATSHTMTKTISVSATVASSYTAISISSQPHSDADFHAYPRATSEPINLSTSMTTANGTTGSIVYTIVNLTGDTSKISTSVSGNGTHTASISGTGTRGRFDDVDYSVTFRVKATDGTSTVYSNYVTFSDTSL